MQYFLLSEAGVIRVPRRRPIKGIFCRHKNQVSGEACSASGMVRISGIDRYKVCTDCGKVLAEYHKDY